ncbi:Intracellular hyphae protein 1 [Colletotrichum orbiculare MAFF 240422]|uniref:Intracellular hyphae protein 1 n=1 Tax=Colletotrichum orbiculare (strain 104-T / ATCC 96160 / CBS 514.97 / LARS 414 / MAFF 240422) TaxID=1213857 RepID=N4UUF4_COLOR|nr:Intracellular hyphae protein 1 [Colletotrichum orbiculare MAFF 240422]
MQTSFVALLAVAASFASALPHGGGSYEVSLPEPVQPEPIKGDYKGDYKPKPTTLPEPTKGDYKGDYKPKPTLPEPTKGDYNATLPVPTCEDGKVKTHKVKSGETLTTIAEKYDSGICNIAKLNNLADPNFLALDQELKIPTHVCEKEKDNTSCIKPEATATCVKDGKKDGKDVYIIKPNDTYTSVAQGLGITTKSLEDANPDAPAEKLEVGQEIKVPVC